MKRLEKEIMNEGFTVLQEKEELVYFEKTYLESTDDPQQVFVMYDRSSNRITSIDAYTLSDDLLTSAPDQPYWRLFRQSPRRSG